MNGGYKRGFEEWVRGALGWTVEVVRRPGAGVRGIWWPKDRPLSGELEELLGRRRGFVVLPRRWVVERTFAWLSFSQRLNRDYELLPETSEAFIYTAMIRIMVRRLAF